MSKQRNLYLDYLKGFAIFCVTWGHCIQGCNSDQFDVFTNSVFQVIYSFHMPLFMFISGYLLGKNEKTFSSICKSRIIGLILPYITWNVLLYFRAILFLGDMKLGIGSLLHYLLKGTWFPKSLLIITLCVSITHILCKKLFPNSIEYVILIVLAVASIFFDQIIEMHTSNLFLPFVIGFIVSRTAVVECYQLNLCGGGYQQNKYCRIGSILCAVLYAIMMLFYDTWSFVYVSGVNPLTSMYSPVIQFLIDIYRWIVGIFGTLCIINITYYIYSKTAFMRNIIIDWGKYSLSLYLMQCFLMTGVISTIVDAVSKRIGYNPLIKNMIIYNFAITPLVAFLYMAIMMFMIKILNKNHVLRMLCLGKR